jgi:hypothetical protein
VNQWNPEISETAEPVSDNVAMQDFVNDDVDDADFLAESESNEAVVAAGGQVTSAVYAGASVDSQGLLPLDVQTGDPRVDAAIAELRDLEQLPVSDHPDVFTQVHRALQDAMLTLDQD